jgi:hypothetical protein
VCSSDLGLGPTGSTTWLPEFLPAPVAKALAEMDLPALERVRDDLVRAIETGASSVSLGDVDLPASPEVLKSIEARIDARRAEAEEPLPGAIEGEEGEKPAKGGAPIILETEDNFFELHWRPETPPRIEAIATVLPTSVTTPLK